MYRLTYLALSLLCCSFLAGAQNSDNGIRKQLQTLDHPAFSNGEFSLDKQLNNRSLGVMHVYGHQTFRGIAIHGAAFNANLRGSEVVNYHQQFLPAAYLKAKGDFQLSATNAIEYVAGEYVQGYSGNFNAGKPTEILPDGTLKLNIEGLSSDPLLVKKWWCELNRELVPAWSVAIYVADSAAHLNVFVDARNGRIIKKENWTHDCSFHGADRGELNRTSTGDEGSGRSKRNESSSYRVFAYPLENPAFGTRSLEEDPWDSLASPFGWHDDDGQEGEEYTITRGNNVYAREDQDADNQGGYSPDGGSALEFDFYYSDNVDSNLDAAITNLFYWNNLMHDLWYHYGFDEESGNFQQNNYNRASNGSRDYVIADARDGSGNNNANFSSPPDGINPRMQMFLWTNSNANLEVLSPGSLKGNYTGKGAAFGPALTTTPLKGQVVLVDDGSSNPRQGCDPLINGQDIDGKIALIERGTCLFTDKVRNAEAQGAIAAIIFTDNRSIAQMGGSANDIDIPSILIERQIGLDLVNALQNGTVEVELSRSGDLLVYDSDFDNGVIAHEYGHGISTRLTGGGGNSGCLQNQEQMGEGWSDFFALVMTSDSSSKGSDRRPIGSYLRGEGANGNGIRTYPYSTDKSISPYTYDDVKFLSVPHGVGSVWCAMLWDLYWEMVDVYGYDPDLYEGSGGNNQCMYLVMDAMKLQPCNPGFVDGRNAILLADRLRNGGANQRLIWEVFAARGLGYNADQGSSASRTDGTEGFNIPPYYMGYVKMALNGPVNVNELDTIRYQIAIENAGDDTFFQAMVYDTLETDAVYLEGMSTCDWEKSANVLTLEIDTLLPGDSVICNVYVRVPKGDYTVVSWRDSVERKEDRVSVQSDEGSNEWRLSGQRSYVGSSSWFVFNEPSKSDQSLILSLDTIDSTSAFFSFHHWYDSEAVYDGGVVEISIDGGEWTDAGEYMILNPYNSVIADNPASNIRNRAAFSGNSNDFIQTVLDMRGLLGNEVKLRFRFVSDGAAAAEGWFIDNFQLMNLVVWENHLSASVQAKVSSSGFETIIYESDDTGIGVYSNRTKPGISLFPNPFAQQLSIRSKETISSYAVYSATGKLVLQGQANSKTMELNTAGLMPGLYLLRIEVEGSIHYYRLIRREE